MAKKYYYAVKVGKIPGIYYNWEDCKKQVTGYSGAVYKKFDTLEEAGRFIDEKSPCKKDDSKNAKKANNEKLENNTFKDDEAVAYVDGSYNVFTKECGFGVVLFTKINGKETFSYKVESKKYSDYRNVTGEIFGSLSAIKKSINYGMKKVYIHYDYTGISNWALGNWKTNNELTKLYKKEFDELSKKIEVEFIKVAAHTGDIYNEEADVLAKKSIGI
ncbi:viroplasmin family protein [Miniphocaeibacter massiliensis]|uniref:ribonuclease H1 domain-containing protein n=1 Tax=Miniphocaeibacter massiliensis TaxID=2041841 RepID=UPI000C085E58|nr:ribonuclease H family protein [Miniphocaeibacter massiliensis]